MTIDICVCTYRRPSIEDTLRSLDRQTLPDGVSARAIVIDNDETPSARDRVEAVAANLSMPVKYIHAPANNISIARNAGLDAATAQPSPFILRRRLTGCASRITIRMSLYAEAAWCKPDIPATL